MPCLYNVRLGSRSWLYDDEGTHVDSTVEAIYRHPDYGKTSTNALDMHLKTNTADHASYELRSPWNSVPTFGIPENT